MHVNGLRVRRRIRAYAVLALLALAAALFSSAPSAHGQGDGAEPTASFATTISAKTYTAGVPVNQEFTSDPDGQGLPRLPEATLTNAPANTVSYWVDYSATGLPAGLTMGQDRIIRGTPESATTNPVTVTYIAAITVFVDPDADGNYDDLTESTVTGRTTFTITVNPPLTPVTFDSEAMDFFNTRIIAWKSGSGWLAGTSNSVNDAGIPTLRTVSSITFPEASGGTGTITYSLRVNRTEEDLSAAASGITFDASTRTLGGTPAAAAQREWAVTYTATDQNGLTAKGYTTVYAGGYGGL